MKNKKKFKKKLYDLLCAGGSLAVDQNGNQVSCNAISCDYCKMHSGFYPYFIRGMKTMKIKIFTDTSRSRLEDKTNEFLQNVQDVCYIRFSTAVADDGTKRGLLYYSVMIQYESFQED